MNTNEFLPWSRRAAARRAAGAADHGAAAGGTRHTPWMSGATIVTLGATPHLDPMARLQPARLLALALLAGASWCSGPALAQGVDISSPGAKGARVYCSMRSSGNSHEVSWTAAYALIKR